MSLTNIFSSSFLFSIGIIIILIGGIFAYVSYRMGEQDHKLNSMIGLISTMAEESRFFRSKIATLQQKLDSTDLPAADNLQYSSQLMGGQEEDEELIDVSDESETNSNKTDESLDDASEADDDNSDTDGSDTEYEEDLNALNLSLANDDNNDELANEFDIEQLPEFKEEIKTIHLDLEPSIALEEANMIEQLDESKNEEDITFLKNLSITDLGEEDVSKTEYKKMSINKLRELVVSKGLSNDASKLKKNDILKLLDNE